MAKKKKILRKSFINFSKKLTPNNQVGIRTDIARAAILKGEGKQFSFGQMECS